MITGKGGFIGGYLAKHLNTENLVIHCAAAPSYEEDLSLAKKVFDHAFESKSSVVFLSSISVYGDISESVVTEETIPFKQNSYAKAKWDIEGLLRTYDLNSLTLRLPGVVGLGAHDIFLSRTLAGIRRGELVKAYNPESLFNNVVHVGEVSGFIHKWSKNQIIGHNTVNLGSKEPITIREVVSLLGGVADFIETNKKSFLIGIEKAVNLGFEPSTVRKSIKSYVSEFRQVVTNLTVS